MAVITRYDKFGRSYTGPVERIPTTFNLTAKPTTLATGAAPEVKPREPGDIAVSKARAERLGIPESMRLHLTREELTEFERKGEPRTEPSAREERVAVQQEKVAELNRGIETQREETILPTISLGRKEQALEEKPSARQQALEEQPALTRLLETSAVVLGATAAVLTGVGVATGAITAVTKAGIVGHSIATATGTKVAIKGFQVATNSKTIALTTSLLKKTFTLVKNPAFIVSAIGSYPFSSFIKEEAIQTMSIPIMKAIDAGDFETAAAQTEEVDAMLADSGGLLALIPYANLVSSLGKFFEAARKANNAWKKIIAKKAQTAEAKAAAPTFAEERETADVEARERELGERAEDTEFFERQREENRQRELEERERDALYFSLIREGRYEEAEELLQEELK